MCVAYTSVHSADIKKNHNRRSAPFSNFSPFSLLNDSPACQVMELKGQMIHVPESCSLMFLGSPRVDKLEELMGRGLHLSDIPIHDATRDVILVGEQAKAQDGLKKRMDKLKVQILLLHSESMSDALCTILELYE